MHAPHMLTSNSHEHSLMSMGRMVQIRNMPESMHRRLKARAAEAGLSLSDYLLRELKRTAEQPTTEELLARLQQREPFHPKTPPAKALREERQRR